MAMNTSCPNEGHNRLLCHDPHLVGRITEAVKNEIADRPLVIKLAYIPPVATEPWSQDSGAGHYTYARVTDDSALELMVRQTVAHGTVQAIAAINTISAQDSSMRLAGRRCPARAGSAAACAGMQSAVPDSIWSRAWLRSVSDSGWISRSSAWAAWWNRRITTITVWPAPTP